jgi:uncharacterized protein (DUF305 family)
MGCKPMIYSLTGLLIGSVSTTLIVLSVIKTSLQTPALVTQAQTATPQASPSIPAPTPFRSGMMGQSDQHFIVMMIPHHDGAVAMADLALSRAKHPELKKLAQAIKTTQTKEIQQMRTWYKQWYSADVPGWGPGRVWGWNSGNRQQQGKNQQPVWGPGMGMYRNWDDWDRNWGSGGMMGGSMMRRGWMGTDLYALKNASDFDREFIQQMIPHHQMGVMMASMVLNSSKRPEIRNLAQSIIKSQTDEINQMQQWYQRWYQS